MRWVWIGLVLLVAACTATPAPPPAPTTTSTTVLAPVSAGDWPTYHLNNERTGAQPNLAPAGQLSLAWHAKLDGAVYALDPATGTVRWQTHLGTPQPLKGLPCGDIDPLGITGTMAYDRFTNRLFAVAETAGGSHTLIGMDVDTGAVVVQTMVDPPKGDSIAHQQRAALSIVDNRVFIAYGGLFGDCGNYIGTVLSVRTDGADPHSYVVPTRREGGIWAPGGGALNGLRLMYAVGNGEATGGQYDDSDSVLALTTDSLNRVDIFTPETWADDNAHDLDLGSSNPVSLGAHVLVTGKRGISYVLDGADLSHSTSQLATCPSLGSPAVQDNIVAIPCRTGPKTMSFDNNGQLTPMWSSPVPAAGSPTIGGDAVWAVDVDGGVLYALDLRTGAVRGQLQIGPAPHFASPTLSGDHAYVGTMDGVVSVAGA
jgi:polyvinyl alcohol dehydrogenase (cytochrome)